MTYQKIWTNRKRVTVNLRMGMTSMECHSLHTSPMKTKPRIHDILIIYAATLKVHLYFETWSHQGEATPHAPARNINLKRKSGL